MWIDALQALPVRCWHLVVVVDNNAAHPAPR
jgi:hypothetical protein